MYIQALFLLILLAPVFYRLCLSFTSFYVLIQIRGAVYQSWFCMHDFDAVYQHNMCMLIIITTLNILSMMIIIISMIMLNCFLVFLHLSLCSGYSQNQDFEDMYLCPIIVSDTVCRFPYGNESNWDTFKHGLPYFITVDAFNGVAEITTDQIRIHSSDIGILLPDASWYCLLCVWWWVHLYICSLLFWFVASAAVAGTLTLYCHSLYDPTVARLCILLWALVCNSCIVFYIWCLPTIFLGGYSQFAFSSYSDGAMAKSFSYKLPHDICNWYM